MVEVPSEIFWGIIIVLALPITVIAIGLLVGIFYDYFKWGRGIGNWIIKRFTKDKLNAQESKNG